MAEWKPYPRFPFNPSLRSGMEDKMDKIYRLPARPEAKEANVVKGDKYRITVLTEGLLRLEYSEDGVFEDRATQTVLNRDFPETDYEVKETEEELVLVTKRLRLTYNRKAFDPRGLMVQGCTAWERERPGITGTSCMI